jgi:Fur family peroxide stress response transcriptional regulator
VKQRFSRKREAIYACLCGTDSHPTADWIYQQLLPSYPDLSLATVYRNLAQMKQTGLIQSVGVVSGQERFDAVAAPHTHFICTGCNAVLDLFDVEPPETLVAQAEAASGCQITGTSLRFTGLCPRCRQTLS